MARRGHHGAPRARALLAALTLTAVVTGAVGAPRAAEAADVAATRLPRADASIAEATPGTPMGASATKVEVDVGPNVRALMSFDLQPPQPGMVLKSAMLSVHCVNSSSTFGGSVRLLSSSFDEATVTWNTAAATFGEQIGTLPSVISGTRYNLNVTAAAQGRTELNVGFIGASTNGADFASKESTTASQRPTLTLVFDDGTGEPPPPPGDDELPGPDPTEEPPGPDTTLTQPPLADATIAQGTPATSFGTLGKLDVDNSPVERFLMRFDVRIPPNKVLRSATLSLFNLNSTSSGGSFRELTGGFSESTVTWDTAPGFGTQVLASLGSVSSGRRYSVNLTAAARDKQALNIGVVGASSDGAEYASKEAATASQRPVLTIVYGDPVVTPPPDPDPQPGESFDMGLIGDVPYSSSEASDMLDLRSTMNAANLSYAVHVGDIKSGSSACSDSVYTNVRNILNGFEAPVLYTPGDNEWSDCDGIELNRLSFLRGIFFANSQTMGIRRETVLRQPNYPENARWSKGGIMFATVHTVGSSDYSGSERDARRRANVEWIHAAFDAADAGGSRGVVIITHANWGSPYGTSRTAFEAVKGALHDEVLASTRPVVFVHGDTHQFRIDKPLKDSSGDTVEHFTRIEVHAGADDWVRLRVTTGPEVFVASSQSR